MRILICDDDSSIIQLLSQIVTTYFNNKKITCPEIVTFDNGNLLQLKNLSRHFIRLLCFGTNNYYP